MPAVRDFLSRFTPKRTQSRPTVAPTSSKKLYIDNTEIKSFLSFGKSTARNFPEYAKNYAISLFPIATWIRRYNTTWLVGDLIAALTVGMLIIPQSMAQAQIATLPPQYGLYSAFTGLVIYAFFATSKDISIGTTAVLSLFTSQVLASANVKASGENIYSPPIFAITLAFIVGIYQLAIGIFRLGVIIDLIPTTLISGFTTGAAVTIIIQQLPGLLGVSGINTNSQPTYGILRDMFNSIGLMNNKMDAVWGLTAALFLIIAKQIKAKYGKRYPVAKYFGLASNGVVLIFSTLFSYLIVHFKFSDVAKSVPYAIVGTVPSGFRQPQVPQLDSGILSHVLSPAISVAIVAVVEQIAIAKSFGRQSGYTINVSQELVATGITNIFGSFLGAYPATGSFSRSAVKAAAGVRTPAAGWFASILVVIALYLITPAFYFIPKATLCAIIIASISDLVSRYPTFIELWNVSLLDFFICQVALWVTLLTTLEIGIYSSLALAFAVLIARIARPHLTTLGKLSTGAGLYVPLGKTTDAQIELPPAGILIFRIEESFTFLNAGYVCDEMLAFIRKHTEFGGVARSKGDLLWCDDSNERFAKQQITPVKSATSAAAPVLRDSELVAAAAAGVGEDEVVKTAPATPEKPFGSPNSGTFLLEQGGALLPPLNAILLDFSAVNLLDATSYQALFDFKKSVSRYAGKLVQIHFINVKPQLKRILTNFLLVPIDVNDILPIFNNNTATLNRSLDELIASSEDAEKYFHNDIDAAVETVIQRKTTPRAKTVSEQTA